MQVSSDHWLQTVKWGNKSGELKSWELGIATTMASYAAMDWAKVPSAKQAKHGVRIIATSEDHGVWRSETELT